MWINRERVAVYEQEGFSLATRNSQPVIRMEKPEHHILVCASFRMSGEPQGICHKKGSGDFLGYIENEIIDRGMDGVIVSSTGCLKVCDRGPAMVVYPENTWYGNVENEDAIDTILDAIENGEVAEDYAIG